VVAAARRREDDDADADVNTDAVGGEGAAAPTG
jgi:hypothetical protein